MAPTNIVPPAPVPLSQKELARVQKFPCNGERIFDTRRARGLTYSEVYEQIFLEEGCKKRDDGHRTFTTTAMERIKRLNTFYWKRAKAFIEKEWAEQRKQLEALQELMKLEQTAMACFETNEKELAALRSGERVIDAEREAELVKLIEAAPFERKDGKIVRKQQAPKPDEESNVMVATG